jgi:hypothetical protein
VVTTAVSVIGMPAKLVQALAVEPGKQTPIGVPDAFKSGKAGTAVKVLGLNSVFGTIGHPLQLVGVDDTSTHEIWARLLVVAVP